MVSLVLLLTLALVVAAAVALGRRRRVSITGVPTPGLNEAQWFASFAQLNDVRVHEGGGVSLRNRSLSWSMLEGVVTGAWQRYAARYPAHTRPPYYRSIKVVLRDWHDRALGKSIP